MDKILLVEDSMMNINVLRSALSDRYKIFVAVNGEIALEILEKYIPDIILLDVTMPVMDGYETYKNIINIKNLNGIPVIFLTATEMLDHDMQALDPSRFVKVIKKPFDLTDVQNTIEWALRVKNNE